jgi:hypothetical protein
MSNDAIQPADIANLTHDDFAELLEELEIDLEPDQMQAAAALVQQLGGVQAALLALQLASDKAA